jgi:very-short-patch-repair endonuclease
MRADDISVEPGSSPGVLALKNYLAYAETGLLDQPKPSGREPDSDFEVTVAQALRAAGYQCTAQVGVAGFFIDLAVKDPDEQGRYLIGVECDGATYHSAKSVRDRDRLRQAILENLGWRIHRIWSADWFKNTQQEVEKLLAVLQKIRSETKPAARAIEQEVAAAGVEREVILITEDEAHERLVTLRETRVKVEMPNVPPETGLLRKQMLKELLKHRPTSIDEFRTKIPVTYRQKTNGEQLKRYGQEVFEILALTG